MLKFTCKDTFSISRKRLLSTLSIKIANAALLVRQKTNEN